MWVTLKRVLPDHDRSVRSVIEVFAASRSEGSLPTQFPNHLEQVEPHPDDQQRDAKDDSHPKCPWREGLAQKNQHASQRGHRDQDRKTYEHAERRVLRGFVHLSCPSFGAAGVVGTVGTGCVASCATMACRVVRAGDDYSDYIVPLARAVANGEVEWGVAICGSGVGASIAANKVPGVRAGLIHDVYSAHQGVEDDDMNVLCLGSRVIGADLAKELVDFFLEAHFSGDERHRRRLAKVAALEGQPPGA